MESFVIVLVKLIVLLIVRLKESPKVSVEFADSIFTLFIALDWIDVEILLTIDSPLKSFDTIVDEVRSRSSPDIVALKVILEIFFTKLGFNVCSLNVHTVIFSRLLILSVEEAELDIGRVRQVLGGQRQVSMNLTKFPSFVIYLHLKSITIKVVNRIFG